MSPNRRTYTSSDIEKGFSESRYFVEPDRKAAINLAVSVSKAGDIILKEISELHMELPYLTIFPRI